MRRSAFALLEIVLVISILSAMTAISIPAYREYHIRSDLDKTAQQVTQGLGRAKLLATSGENDSDWGFYVPSGTLYRGGTYESRDTVADEVYPMPSTIAVSGLLDISFSRVEGSPSDTGDIVLRALNNDERVIQVTIAVDKESIATNEADLLTICHHPAGGGTESVTIPDATWPYHQGHGDTNGPCPVAASSSSVASSANSAAAASSSSVASSSGGGGGGSTSSVINVGGSSSAVSSSVAASSSSSSAASCGKFTVSANQTVTLTAASSVTFLNKLSLVTFGQGGPVVPVHVCYSKNNGSSYLPLFGGSGNCNGNGNAYGNAVTPGGTNTKTVSLSSGNKVIVKINGRYSQNGWLAFNETYTSTDQSGHIKFLRNGDTLANYPGFGSQTPLQNYLTGQGMLNAQGKIVLNACEILSIAELGTLGSAGADFQDDVLLMTFN